MKIVHITTYINGGAGTAAFRIHEALLKQNVDSKLLCTDFPVRHSVKEVSHYNKPIFQIGQRVWRKLKRILAKYFNLGPLNFRFRLKHDLENLNPQLIAEFTGLPFSEYNILDHPLVKEADIIHLHWVANFLDYPSFFKHNTKPIVWTLHDMNPILGLYHYEADEKRNLTISDNIDAKVKKIKKNALLNVRSKLMAISPSQWLNQRAAKCSNFLSANCLKIPYPINTEKFSPRDTKELRKVLNIPAEHTVFLFVSQSINNYRKGFDLLLEALQKLSNNNISLLIIGYAEKLNLPHLHCISLGFISDEEELSNYYSLADAFILPSREDNLPNVMLEALACGTPVISFNVGGMATIIQNGITGLIVEIVTADSLKQTLENFLSNKEKFNRNEIRNYAMELFNEEKIALAYLEVYKNLLAF